MDDLSLVDPSLLPPGIKRLMAIIGLPETLRLLQHRGGVPCYIPATLDRSQQLKAVLSVESIVALTKSDLAGQTIELPKDDKITKQLRNLAVQTAAKNTSQVQAARKFHLSRRHVINICNANDDSGTLDLFQEPGSQ